MDGNIVACAAGVTSENVAAKYSIPREEQDKMAAQSHKRAAAATASGRFKDEIVPVKTMWKDPKSGGQLSILWAVLAQLLLLSAPQVWYSRLSRTNPMTSRRR